MRPQALPRLAVVALWSFSLLFFEDHHHVVALALKKIKPHHPRLSNKQHPLLQGRPASFHRPSMIPPQTSHHHHARRTLTQLRGGALPPTPPLSSPPPLKSWIGQALSCALSYALYNLFIKKASTGIDPILGGCILQFVAALLGTALWLLKPKVAIGSSQAALMSRVGLFWAIAAGAAVGAAEIMSFVISSKGVQAMQSIPIIIGGSVLFGTVLGSLWLKEALSLRGWFGVFCISAGIALVGMDGGASLH